jgi:hypothetical protein
MNNPPAFPQCAYNMKGGYDITGGMTLRDYFAAKALPWVAEDLPASDGFYTKVATLSYELADAMMKAREA